MCRLSRYIAAVVLMVSPDFSWSQEQLWLAGSQTELERRFDEAFSQHARLDFDDTPLEEFIDYLRGATKIDIVIDRQALAEAKVAADAPVSLHVDHVSYKSALKLVLDPLDLTWVYRGEVLMVTSNVEAEQMLTTRIYEVHDLLEGDSSGSLNFAPLVNLITSCIAPTSWDDVGGPASIGAFRAPNIHVLIVSQTPEAHDEIGSLLAVLRAVADRRSAQATAKSDPDERPASAPRVARHSRVYVAAPRWSLPRVHE